MSRKKSELIGERFGRLLVIAEFGRNKFGDVVWICKCDCGKESKPTTNNLKRGTTKSCGCVAVENLVKRTTTHGCTNTPEYYTWQIMIDRCYNPKNKKYHRYGARGILVDERWLNSFECFLEDMGKRPESNKKREYSIERKNNNGNYGPSNCYWGTQHDQHRNRSDNNWIEYNGEKLILQDWATKFKTHHANILRMLKGHSFEYAYNHYMNKLQ